MFHGVLNPPGEGTTSSVHSIQFLPRVPMGIPIPPKSEKKSQPVIYRNLFHTIVCKFCENTAYENCRVYIDDFVGYSGNAKRFKKRPDKGEKALFLSCSVTDPMDKPITQCLACKDYFENQKYFKANPECVGKVVLIKNNTPIRVENLSFKIMIKMMCCGVHQSVDYFVLVLSLTDSLTNEQVNVSKVHLNVKQWRKSSQKKDDFTVMLT